jgi:DNA-binding transcriptional MerR regulator
MRIGELAKRTGLATSRIRFYEKSGLIGGVERQGNGFREYGPESLWMLEIIASAQSVGFSLDEIRSLLPDAQDNWQHDALLESLQRKVAEIEGLQKRLEQNKAQLLAAIESIQNRPEDLACADRPEWVLNRLREGGVAFERAPLPTSPSED